MIRGEKSEYRATNPVRDDSYWNYFERQACIPAKSLTLGGFGLTAAGAFF